jgi:hypothetical protein
LLEQGVGKPTQPQTSANILIVCDEAPPASPTSNAGVVSQVVSLLQHDLAEKMRLCPNVLFGCGYSGKG